MNKDHELETSREIIKLIVEEEIKKIEKYKRFLEWLEDNQGEKILITVRRE